MIFSSVLRFLIYPNVPLLNSVFFANAELSSRPISIGTVFLFQVYQASKRMTDRIFQIVSKQLKLQRQTYDLTAEVKSLKETFLHETDVAEIEIGIDKKVARLSYDCILNLNGEHVKFRM